MTDYYTHVHALIDPEMSDPLPEGGRLQDVSVILTDTPRGHDTLRPAAITLLAFELLEAAEHADRMRTLR